MEENLDGCRSLWISVIQSAVDDIVRGKEELKKPGKKRSAIVVRDGREALSWIVSQNKSPFNSFENICQELGLSSNQIRGGLREKGLLNG